MPFVLNTYTRLQKQYEGSEPLRLLVQSHMFRGKVYLLYTKRQYVSTADYYK